MFGTKPNTNYSNECGEEKKNKMHMLSNYFGKESCKFFKAKQLAKNLIINSDQIL